MALAGTVAVRIDDLARCLAAIFTGFGLAPEDARGLGDLLRGPAAAFVGALVEAFLPRSAFAARLDDAIDQIKNVPTLPGVDELRVPGEQADRRIRALRARGVAELAPTAWRSLTTRCEEHDIEPPMPAAGN